MAWLALYFFIHPLFLWDKMDDHIVIWLKSGIVYDISCSEPYKVRVLEYKS
jgi:hypothetical protein